LAEGILHDQKCLIIDFEENRKREFWINFLP